VTAETIRLIEAELRAAYPAATATTDGNRRLLRLPEILFPRGCRPDTGSALVVLDPNALKPELYLSEVPVLPSGNRVSVGTVTIGGQSWQTFSYNVGWEEGRHSAIQFLEGKLARLRRGT
jgi:hypothetical protein